MLINQMSKPLRPLFASDWYTRGSDLIPLSPKPCELTIAGLSSNIFFRGAPYSEKEKKREPRATIPSHTSR
jgi:hypothetical protein